MPENLTLIIKSYFAALQDYINIELDSHRNQLIQLELLLTAAMFAMALITVVAGLFGMNLNNKQQGSYSAFLMVLASRPPCPLLRGGTGHTMRC